MARVFPVVFAAGCFIKPSPPGIDVDAPAPTANIAFVTSASPLPGALGGLSKADELCQTLADQQHLPGTYVAWLSAAGMDAAQRLTGSQGWVRVDGRPVANTVDDLTHGRILYPLRITEQSVDVFDGGDLSLTVATGTNPDGTDAAMADCNGFTSMAGDTVTGEADAGGTHWAAAIVTPAHGNCGTPMRIYCFGTGKQVEVAVVPEATHLAFVTNAQIGVTMPGVGDFDTACRGEAAAAGLPGSFLAAVATQTAAVRDRFTYNGPWVRRDGVTTVRTDFLGLAAPIVQDARGDVADDLLAWTGASTFVMKALMANDCANWTISGTTTPGMVGDPSRSGVKGFNSTTKACTASARLYCLQE